MKKIPLRKCTGCGEMKTKKEMIRILKTPEDEVVFDASGKKNGRGAYLCNSADCFLLAKKKKGLERSLQCAIPNEVYEALEKELREFETTKQRGD